MLFRGQIHPLGEATSRRRGLPSQPKTFWDETSQPPSRPSITSGVETSRLHTSHAFETNTPWDETSQPLPAASITSGLETSRLQNSHAVATSVISSGLPLLPIPQPVFKTLKGFQTVAGGKAARPPPPVPRPQNAQPPPLAEGVGGGGIPESPQAVSPDASQCSAIPWRRKKAHRGSPLGRTYSVRVEPQPGASHFCVLLRALRACASYHEG